MISPDRGRSYFFANKKDCVSSVPDDHGIDEGTNIWFFKFILINVALINNYVEKNSHNCG